MTTDPMLPDLTHSTFSLVVDIKLAVSLGLPGIWYAGMSSHAAQFDRTQLTASSGC